MEQGACLSCETQRVLPTDSSGQPPPAQLSMENELNLIYILVYISSAGSQHAVSNVHDKG